MCKLFCFATCIWEQKKIRLIQRLDASNIYMVNDAIL